MKLIEKATGKVTNVSLGGAAVLIGRGTHEPADKPKAKSKPAANKQTAAEKTEE